MADGDPLVRTWPAAASAAKSARIIYILRDGTCREVSVPYGYSVMEGARRHAIPGIEGDCGGACACATCHVYLEEGWAERLPLVDELERGMVDFAYDTRPNSRLSCQIAVDDHADGLVVRVPDRQY
jgi:2Fe-2S ferredoxin